MSIKVYKYRANINRDIVSLFNNEIYASSSKDLNDPCEMRVDMGNLLRNLCNKRPFKDIESEVIQDWAKIIISARKRYGIYSLSGNVDNELLWSHYANGHKGFCIEYNYNVLMKHLLTAEGISKYDCIAAFKIQYTETPPKLTVDNILEKVNNNIEILKNISGTKSKKWKYEEEIRVIFNLYGIKNIIPEAITGIYFGIDMSESDKKYIKDKLHNNIKYYQMYLEPNSYSLKSHII